MDNITIPPEALEKAARWRPISEAPPYRHVIVWVPASAGRNGHIRHNTIWGADEGKWVDANFDVLEVQPTHFIPISALGEPTNGRPFELLRTALNPNTGARMSENEYQESYHFITSHPEAVARQMTHLIVGKRELEVRVKQLEEELRNYACTCEKGYCALKEGSKNG